MINASRWGANEKIVLKGLSEHFSEKICCNGENLIVMEATIIRDLFVMCNVKKV